MRFRFAPVAVAFAGILLATSAGVTAQSVKDVKTPDTPLVLKAQGSFFIGGDKVEQTRAELGDLGPGGRIGRLKGAGGQAEMLAPPDRGIRGNSHMIMQDTNNLHIADLILAWVAERVSKQGGAKK